MKVEDLIEIAESANIPANHTEDFVDLVTVDRWTISIFYDCGEFDYIEWITSPEGIVYDPWNPEKGTRAIKGRLTKLQNWRPESMRKKYSS